jgi:membrane-associated phospholipid phosphatase
VDLPFVTVTLPDSLERLSDPGFRFGHAGSFGRHWTAPWKAWNVLAGFTDTEAWRNRQRRQADGTLAAGPGGLDLPGWQARLLAKAPPGSTDVVPWVDAEIDALVLAAETERADALGEILSQDDGFVPEFLGLLGATPSTHPATGALMDAAMLVGLAAAQHFKQVNDRPRPAQVCAALRPPVEAAGHAAYPSGHATQAFLIVRSLEAAFAGKAMLGALPALTALAARIARNREIAGLHYPSDGAAGRELADLLHAALQPVPSFGAIQQAAAAEWS